MNFTMGLPLAIGTVLDGRYRITFRMGDGATGEVYEAEDLTIADRHVAIKLLREEWSHDATIIARFKREIKVMTKLSGHPNMVHILDGGQFRENGRLFIAMEVLIGRTLAQEILMYIGEEDPMPADHACRILQSIARGVGYAHHNKIIHRDLKPSNIMLVDAGDKTLVKVLDFGLAILLETEHTNTRITRVGMLGTKGYIPPEQMTRTEEPGPSLDIYAMGVILVEMLTGFRPQDPTCAAKELESLRGGLPKDIYALVDECLKSDPEERPCSMEAIIERLDPIFEELEIQRRKAPKPLTLRQIRREYAWRTKWRKRVFAGIGGVALLGVMGLLGWWWSQRIHDHEETHSQTSVAMASEKSAETSVNEHETSGNENEPSQAETSEIDNETSGMEATSSQAGTSETRHEPNQIKAESSGTGEEKEQPASEQKADATPKKQHESFKEKRCEEVRALAQEASKQFHWHELLKHTKAKECWKSPSERMTLRIRALFSLKQYSQCVREGSSFTSNSKIASMVEFCRNQVQKEP